MSDDEETEYVIKKETGDIETGTEIYVQAASTDEAKELFDHAEEADIR